MKSLLSLTGMLVMVWGCQGPRGPEGPSGVSGDAGETGPVAPQVCVPATGGTAGLNASLTLSRPSNGQYFTVGERPVATIKLTDNCSNLIAPSALNTAQIYLAGPRHALTAKTALKLLNATDNRAAADRQHHFISLKSPSYKDPTQHNLSIAADGTITYQLGAVSDETAGSYTFGVWAKTNDQKDQTFVLGDLQIGTATVETYAPGAPATATCLACHQGPISGKVYMHHTFPGFSPLGDYALDSAPVGSCFLCHNLNGYSMNPLLRKVHGVHRGEHQLAPGVAHPEYNLPADPSLVDYLNVGFASTPDHEKDCTKCHADDRWQKNPSRLACGTCHDNVFFDVGALTPPRNFGRPAGGAACNNDSQCTPFGALAVCDSGSGNCIRSSHPPQLDDSQCATCHGPDNGISPIATRHAILSRVESRGLKVTNVTISGGTGPNGAFLVGDHPSVAFKVSDRDGNNVGDVLTNANLSGTAIGAGPNDDPRRVFANVTMAKNTALTYNAGTQTYTYVFSTGWPANNVAPVNNTDVSFIRPNPSGAYSIYIYVVEALPAGQRDSVGVVTPVRFVTSPGADASFPALARETIQPTACNSCHVDLQLHGGSRSDPEGCFTCHNYGGQDKAVGSAGISCPNGNTDCPGFNATPALSWESCVSGKCTITQDPTPNQTVEYGPMVHEIHYGRRLGLYNERNNLVPGLEVVGFNNVASNFTEVLFPQDIRNCTKCHANSNATCSSSVACNFGQTCVAGKCQNSAWKVAKARICLSCHDNQGAYVHAALNTTSLGVETCEVCHGDGRELATTVVHNISSPYVPPYPRTEE